VTIVVALVIAAVCVAASLRRIVFAVAPTSLDPVRLAKALRGDAGRARFVAIDEDVRRRPEGDWERALFEAMRRPASERAAHVNEQLTEVDYLTKRWDRVPRVCASVASSSGFLLAAVALRTGLSDPAAFDPETKSAILGAALVDAVDTAAIGIAGAAFCIAAQMVAKKAARAHADAIDDLVERLEALTASR
jgi:hypothetical protein